MDVGSIFAAVIAREEERLRGELAARFALSPESRLAKLIPKPPPDPRFRTKLW